MNIKVGDIDIGNDLPFVLIAGPCQIESEQHAIETAAMILDTCRSLGIQLIYKSSFDKANRSSISTKRGIGIDEGLKILNTIKTDTEFLF